MIQVVLPADTEELLRERAKASGEDVSSFAARLLQGALTRPSVDELLAPFRNEVEKSGMTDEQLKEFGEELRREVHEQQARNAANA